MMKRRVLEWYHFAILLVAWIVLSGCASRYTNEAIRALNPSARFAKTCVRHPALSDRAEVYAYNARTRETVADSDWDLFEEAAEKADILYRFDPDVPARYSHPLPWPYEYMTCDSVSSSKVSPLPQGMWVIPISHSTREALVATLVTIEDESEAVGWNEAPAQGSDKRFLGQTARILVHQPSEKQIATITQSRQAIHT
jgi:hypothetical protein